MKFKAGMLIVLSFILIAIISSLSGATYAQTDSQENERKIVVFKQSLVSELDKDKVLNKYGVKKIKHLALINAAAVTVSPAKEKALKSNENILRIDPDILLYTQAKPSAPAPAPETLPWGVDRIDADLVWDRDSNLVIDAGSNAGKGVRVAVLDTGIDLDHPDLAGNIKGGINTINPFKSVDDDNGHGTHVAGIIAAVDNSVGVMGVAPNSYLYAVKVLDRKGSGYLSDIIEGLQWCIDNRIQVANMSFGTSTNVQSLYDSIIAAFESGIVLVAAAGNSGPGDNTVQYPARYPEVIAVFAVDANNMIASWSSRGTEVELAAPGVNIYSTYSGGRYKTLSGTSMASPHVAGAAALVIGSGTVSPGDIREKLRTTADDLGVQGKDFLFGYGLVDAEEAASGIQTNP